MRLPTLKKSGIPRSVAMFRIGDLLKNKFMFLLSILVCYHSLLRYRGYIKIIILLKNRKKKLFLFHSLKSSNLFSPALQGLFTPPTVVPKNKMWNIYPCYNIWLNICLTFHVFSLEFCAIPFVLIEQLLVSFNILLLIFSNSWFDCFSCCCSRRCFQSLGCTGTAGLLSHLISPACQRFTLKIK